MSTRPHASPALELEPGFDRRGVNDRRHDYSTAILHRHCRTVFQSYLSRRRRSQRRDLCAPTACVSARGNLRLRAAATTSPLASAPLAAARPSCSSRLRWRTGKSAAASRSYDITAGVGAARSGATFVLQPPALAHGESAAASRSYDITAGVGAAASGATFVLQPCMSRQSRRHDMRLKAPKPPQIAAQSLPAFENALPQPIALRFRRIVQRADLFAQLQHLTTDNAPFLQRILMTRLHHSR